MSTTGIPANELETVGHVVATNDLRFNPEQDVMTVAMSLVSTYTNGGVVLNDSGKLIGFISEIDTLRAVELGRNLRQLTVKEIMTPNPLVVHESTPIGEAVRTMAEKHILSLPVVRDDKTAYSVTRHDLLRAVISLGLGGK